MGFLSMSALLTLWATFCGWLHYRMFSSNHGHYSLHAINNFSLLVPTRNVSRLCQMVLWRQNCPWRITTLQGHCDLAATLLSIAWYQVNCLLWNLPLISCNYFMMLSGMRFPDLSAVLLDIISLSLVTGKVPKQFKNNCCCDVAVLIAYRSET